MDHFGEDTGRRKVPPHRSPTARRHARFLGEFAHGAVERRLARVEFAGRNLPQEVLDAKPVLADETCAIRAVQRHHGGRARMAHQLQLVFAAVRIPQNLAGDLDDASAMQRVA